MQYKLEIRLGHQPNMTTLPIFGITTPSCYIYIYIYADMDC